MKTKIKLFQKYSKNILRIFPPKQSQKLKNRRVWLVLSRLHPTMFLKMNLQKLHAQKKKFTHEKNALCFVFSHVNDNKKVDHNNLQMMCCILCCITPINASNPKTQARKNLISYYKTNGIITIFNKHVTTYMPLLQKRSRGNKSSIKKICSKAISKRKA
jgi:hypothetical protein